MASYSILNALGGRAVIAAEPTAPGDWATRIESGLPYASALAFKDALGITNAELAAVLGISPRTLARMDPVTSRLDLVSGDRLVRAARLLTIATDVLEDVEAATRWLKSPQRALGGAIPLQRAATDVGAREVETLLGRMEHGVFT
jgi:putative toxin-antitoxin system antitoxin component (TIGR02293 family)